MKTDFQEFYDPLALGVVAFLIIVACSVIGWAIWGVIKDIRRNRK